MSQTFKRREFCRALSRTALGSLSWPPLADEAMERSSSRQNSGEGLANAFRREETMERRKNKGEKQ
jgi:hypothetical protein